MSLSDTCSISVRHFENTYHFENGFPNVFDLQTEMILIITRFSKWRNRPIRLREFGSALLKSPLSLSCVRISTAMRHTPRPPRFAHANRVGLARTVCSIRSDAEFLRRRAQQPTKRDVARQVGFATPGQRAAAPASGRRRTWTSYRCRRPPFWRRFCVWSRRYRAACPRRPGATTTNDLSARGARCGGGARKRAESTVATTSPGVAHSTDFNEKWIKISAQSIPSISIEQFPPVRLLL